MDRSEATTPEYISHPEWVRMKQARKMRIVLRLGLFFSGIALAFGLFYVRAVFIRWRSRAEVLGALAKLGDYEVGVKIVGKDGKLVPWRKEVHIGRDWQVDLWGGGMRFTKHGAVFYTDDPTAHLTKTYSAADSVRNFVERASQAASTLNLWNALSRKPWLNASDLPNGGRSWQFHAYDGEWTVSTDPSGVPDQIAFRTGPFELGSDAEIGTVSTADLRFAPYNLYPAIAPKVKLPSVPVPGGTPIPVIAADMNSRGDAFFCFPEDSVRNANNIYRAKQDRYYTINPFPMKVFSQDVTELEFPTDDEDPPVWPTTLHIFLVTDNLKQVDFFYTFDRPTCYLLPSYDVPTGGDRIYFRTLHDFTLDRVGYFNDVVWVKGQPRMLNTLNQTIKYKVHPADREEAARLSFIPIICDHATENPSDEGAFKTLQQDWYTCSRQLNRGGPAADAERAKKAGDSLGPRPATLF